MNCLITITFWQWYQYHQKPFW